MALSMFSDTMIIQDRKTQTIAGQVIPIWSNGATIEGELSISNMQSVRLAEAQGVRATGTLLLDLDAMGRDKYPVSMNTFLYHPKSGVYIRVADQGVVEAGSGAGILNKRQYAVEALSALPQ